MKFIHLSDLHLGIRVCEYSMLEDQEYILTKIINIIDDEEPDGIIIAGDIYDKSVPPAEAVQLFDSFLTRLAKRNVKVFIISGNHDSQERISFGSNFMALGGIYVSPVYSGHITPITVEDEYGQADIFMLPFIKPAHVRRYFQGQMQSHVLQIDSYNDALRTVISDMNIDITRRNILITHQFVTGASRSESEEITVGGTDNVDVALFENFDYVALGHIHSPQNCTENRVRYCGTPLKYSFSEANDCKSVTVVEIKNKGELNVRTVNLQPLRDMREIKGTYNQLMLKSFYENTTYQQDYLHITLTDEEDIPDAIGKLRTVYRNLMKLDYDNKRTRSNAVIDGDADVETKTPLQLFADFYELQNNRPMNAEQESFMKELIEEVWECATEDKK